MILEALSEIVGAVAMHFSFQLGVRTIGRYSRADGGSVLRGNDILAGGGSY